MVYHNADNYAYLFDFDFSSHFTVTGLMYKIHFIQALMYEIMVNRIHVSLVQFALAIGIQKFYVVAALCQ